MLICEQKQQWLFSIQFNLTLIVLTKKINAALLQMFPPIRRGGCQRSQGGGWLYTLLKFEPSSRRLRSISRFYSFLRSSTAPQRFLLSQSQGTLSTSEPSASAVKMWLCSVYQVSTYVLKYGVLRGYGSAMLGYAKSKVMRRMRSIRYCCIPVLYLCN